MTKTYFFTAEVFKHMPYGATTKGALMMENADIVIHSHGEDHIILKQPIPLQHPKGIEIRISHVDFLELKNNWQGNVVITPSL